MIISLARIDVKKGRFDRFEAQYTRFISECLYGAERGIDILDGRVVCSKDITSYLKSRPEERPLLLQAMGQLLLKASQPSTLPAPRLVQHGVIGNVAFYSHEDDSFWRESFRKHALRSRVSPKVTLPEFAQGLMGTEHESLGKHAAAGFVKEYGPLLDHSDLSDWKDLPLLTSALRAARQIQSDHFRLGGSALISRGVARDLLKGEYSGRREGFITDRLNVNRHLSLLRFPQSTLFAEVSGCRYLPEQVSAYTRAQWPISMEDFELMPLVWRCLAYGCVPS